MILPEPKLFKGDIFVDDRGILGINNDLDLSPVKRFYTVTNHTPGFIRAWHGHEKEAKYFTMLSGSAIVLAVQMMLYKNNWSLNWDIQSRVTLIDNYPTVFYIPPGYANGFKLLTPNAKLMVFSTSTLEESKLDDIRFEYIKEFQDIYFTVDER